MYRIRLKSFQYFDVDDAGRVMYDSERGYRCEPHDGWKILGFSRRHHSYHLVTLEQASTGADLGHGFVHDLDHGTQRMWAHPSDQRATKVEIL